MTDVSAASRRKLGPAPVVALLLTAGLLQACAGDQSVRGSRNRLFAVDLAGGAKLCQVPKVSAVENQTIEVPMGLGNDGGWCGVTLQRGDAPFDAGLLTTRPAHGSVLVHQVGDFTRIDYRPDRGFTGADTFTVKLLPGNAGVRVNVTVNGSAKT
jgi:hypothetical protein